MTCASASVPLMSIAPIVAPKTSECALKSDLAKTVIALPFVSVPSRRAFEKPPAVVSARNAPALKPAPVTPSVFE